ncbi:MAG: tyrosine-protein phosphatase [Opitutaceae bacterium]
MPITCLLTLLLALALTSGAVAGPRIRPANWAEPLVETSLANAFRVSPELYRCEQPTTADLADLRALGIRTVLNLRKHHDDPDAFAAAGLKLLAEPMNAGEVTEELLVSALRQFREAPKPVAVHCWHGSDRTGVFVAAYRIVFQGWARKDAIDEFRHGGYGYHARWYPNLVELLEKLDVDAVRAKVLAPAATATAASRPVADPRTPTARP